MRWIAAPDLYEPPENYLIDLAELALEARWAGVPVWVLAKQSEYWRSVIRLGREVESALNNKNFGVARKEDK
jgi:hypothetical protein